MFICPPVSRAPAVEAALSQNSRQIGPLLFLFLQEKYRFAGLAGDVAECADGRFDDSPALCVVCSISIVNQRCSSGAAIACGRGDDRGAWVDLERAVTRARAVEDAFRLGGSIAHAARVSAWIGRHDDARRFVDELESLGTEAFTLAVDGTTEIAWLAVDFGRSFELAPSPSVWREAHDAILAGRLNEAIGVLDATGVRTEAAYARLRRAECEPGPWLDEAEAFYSEVRAIRFLREAAKLRGAATRRRSA